MAFQSEQRSRRTTDVHVVEDHILPRGSGEMVRDYARMDDEDERVKDNISHRHFIVALKAAWRILNDGVEIDSKRPPTAR